ncbi:DUF4129 domain-containing protein [Nocardioides sp.]|jgi:hypothetical protein|uniref:DUF4129 domain-containing protein n=1 Tax=Nocardioides sp. TaxID=35761 RepID=UPI002F3FBFC3
MLAPDPPLQPSGDEGRRLLRDELVHGEYHRQHVLQRLIDWLWRHLQDGVGAASGSSGVTAFVTMLVAAALVVGLALLLTRVRRDRRTRVRSDAVLTGDRASADDLRRLAEAALAEGRHADALVDAFRALAVRQVERGRLSDQPGATAHEVAASLATSYPTHGGLVGRSADLFDATLYGHHPARPEDAHDVLDLDDALAGPR